MAFFQNLLKVGNSYRKKTLPRIYHSFHRRISAKVNNLLLQPKPAKIQKTKPDKLINQFHYCVCAFVLSPAGLPVQSNLASPLRERERISFTFRQGTDENLQEAPQTLRKPVPRVAGPRAWTKNSLPNTGRGERL